MHYRLHVLDSEGKITTTLELGCKDDERAIAFITDIAPRKCGIELWQNDRLVIRQEARRHVGSAAVGS